MHVNELVKVKICWVRGWRGRWGRCWRTCCLQCSASELPLLSTAGHTSACIGALNLEALRVKIEEASHLAPFTCISSGVSSAFTLSLLPAASEKSSPGRALLALGEARFIKHHCENYSPTFAAVELRVLKGLTSPWNPLAYLKRLMKGPKKEKPWLFNIIEK